MSEKPLPFVVTDRRKFTTEGDPREDALAAEHQEESRSEEAVPAAAPPAEAASVAAAPEEPSETPAAEGEEAAASDLPASPTDEQMEQSRVAFQNTAERLDTAVRAANPGMDHPPAMSFEQLIQSVYMQAVLQLGAGTQEGQAPQIDLLGARQSIDMLGILEEKTRGNLSDAEKTLLSNALFELRLAFLEMTQALARSAQQRAGAPGGGAPPAPAGGGGGPRIVR